MTGSPLVLETVFRIGPVPVTKPVVTTWVIMALMTVFCLFLRSRLSATPGELQTTVELITDTIEHQISDVIQRDPRPYRALIGTIFLYILTANWCSLIPGVEPPTASIETDAALALIVLCATVWFGIRVNGLGGYLKTFTQPSWVMIPLNIVEQITRTFSLIIRLFGNIMSGVFVIAIILSLAGLFVPIPLMALDLLTGTVQAYIFAVLACVFIGAAISEAEPASTPDSQQRSET